MSHPYTFDRKPKMDLQKQSEREKSQQITELLRKYPHAPRYHFIAPESRRGYPFDPNGAIFWKGRYHLFYIFQDVNLPHGGHCWGHASSDDLLHWTFHPTALAPNKGDPDTGIFSGGAFVNKEGVPTIIYHGVGAGTCIATAEDDDLIKWKKSPHNPVIPIPKEGSIGWGVYNVFDPHGWVEDDTYYVILGGRVKPYDIRDTAYLFKSQDMIHWEYIRPFYSPNPHWTGEGEDCACPDFFKLGDRHVLLCISHPRGTRCYLGRYQDGTFIPEEHLRMNFPGGACFAPESLIDDKGRRIFWAWALDQQKEGEKLGVMTMPRVLSLSETGSLRIDPPREFDTLRKNCRQRENIRIDAETEIPLDEIKGDCMEIMLSVETPKSGQFGLVVRRSPDGAEQTVIIVDTFEGSLKIDTTRSSLNENICRPFPMLHSDKKRDISIQKAPFALESGEILKLRVFLDKSILEVFANSRQCLTQRIYPTRNDSASVALFSRGGHSKLRILQAWDIAEINGKEA